MNCREVEKSLMDVLDDRGDRERLHRQIKDHLNGCARCTEELAGRAECQRLVQGLPKVEPPLAFTSRVMAQVRETAHRPTLWQRLFLLIPSKLPLQATAVVIISVLAAYLYQKESHHREPPRTAPPASSVPTGERTDRWRSSPAQAPTVESKPQVPADSGAQERREKRSAPPEQPRPFSESQEAKNAIGGIQPRAPARAPMADDSTALPLTPSRPNEKAPAAEFGASARLDQSLPSAGAQAKGDPQASGTALSDASPGAKSPTAGDVRQEQAFSSIDALRSGAAFSSHHELTLRLREPAREDKKKTGLAQLERFLAEPQISASRADFKDLDEAQQRAIKTRQPQTVWISIVASQYDGFKKGLTDLGTIESELSTPPAENDAVSKSSEKLRIKVTILPTLPGPESPSSR
jgi:hypothetical protein